MKIKFYYIPLLKKALLLAALSLLPQWMAAQAVVNPNPPLNLCVGSGYSPLTFKITEGIPTDFANGAGVTYIVNAPANFDFQPGGIIASTTGGGVFSLSATVTATQITITYTLTGTATAPIDAIAVTVNVRATGLSGPVNLVRTGGTAVQTGNAVSDAQNHATLTGSTIPSITTFTSSPVSPVCTGSPVTFTANTTNTIPGTTTYNFSVNGVSQQNTTSNTYTTSSLIPPTANVSVIVANPACAAVTASLTVTVNSNTKPTVTITGTTPFCEGSGSLTLTSSSTTGNQWFLNGTAISGATSQTYSPTTAAQSGTYQVQVTNGTCISLFSDPVFVNIIKVQQYTLTATDGGKYCNGGSGVFFSLSDSQSGTSYQLIRTTGAGTPAVIETFAGTGTGFTFLTQVANPETYKVTATNSGCSKDMLNTVTVQILLPPSTSLTLSSVVGGNNYCEGSLGLQIQLGSFTETDVNYTLVRSLADLVTLPGNGGTIVFPGTYLAGTYSIRAVKNITPSCPTASGVTFGSLTLAAVPATAPTITPAAPAPQCGGSIVLTATPASSPVAVTSYNWYLNGVLQAGNTSTLSATQSGFYEVEAVTSSPVCTTNRSAGVNVTINAVPILTLPVSAQSTAICAGSSTNILVGTAGSPTQSGVVYQLFDNGVAVSGSVAGGNGGQVVLPTGTPSTTSHTYQIQATAASCSAVFLTNTATVAVNAFPIATFTVGGAATVCQGGGNVTLTSSVTSGNQWRKNGVNIGGATAQTYNISRASTANSGNYDLVVTTSGCSTTSTVQTITINPTPNAITVGVPAANCNNTAVPITINSTQTVVNYQLLQTGVPVGSTFAGTGGSLILPTPTLTTGTYSTFTVRATHQTGGCQTSTIVPNIVVNPVPPQPTISVTNSPLCVGAGVVTLTASTIASSYQWYFNGVLIVGATAQTLTRSLASQTGSYAVQSFDAAACPSLLSNPVSISIIAPPTTVYSVSAANGGLYCSGEAGARIQLSGSDASGTNYQLYFNGSPTSIILSGNGGVLDFGLQPAGTYNIFAFSSSLSNCPAGGLAMSGTLTISQRQAIAVLPVSTASGSSTYCSGTSGVVIQLTGFTSTALQYRLIFNGGSTVDTKTVAVNGATLSFSPQTTTGNYTVVGEYPSGIGCTTPMSGSVNVSITPLPAVFAVTTPGGTDYCNSDPGVKVGLSGSELNVNYQLVLNGGTLINTLSGTGAALDFGIQPAGTYTVNAFSVSNPACPAGGQPMSGSAVVNQLPALGVFSVTGGGSYCSGGSGLAVGLSGSETGITYRLYLNGTYTGTFVTRATPGSFSFPSQTAAGIYTVTAERAAAPLCVQPMTSSATIVIINGSLSTFSITGGGTYCNGGSGVPVGLSGSQVGVDYTLLLGGTGVITVAGTGSAFSFGNQAVAGNYTVTAQTASVPACPVVPQAMAGTAVVTVVNLPLVYSVTPGGSVTYCTGGGGVAIGLSNSEAGITYRLLRNGVLTGASVARVATGSFNFASQTVAGTYTITAERTAGPPVCTVNMTGSVVLSLTPLPNQFTLSLPSGATYCSTDAGVLLRLSASELNVSYQLILNGSTVVTTLAGTGSALDFGIQPQGSYTIIGNTNTTPVCSRNMLNSVTINPPVVVNLYNVTGGGSYCAGSPGVAIGLNGSQINVNYKLYKGAVLISTVGGTGSPLSFGNQTVEDSYTIVAESATSPVCIRNMTGSAVIKSNPLPVLAFNLSGSYCTNAGNIALNSLVFPAGGSFSGAGVSGNVFNPAGLSGTVNITYSYTDANGCSNTIVKSTIVNPQPSVSFTLSPTGPDYFSNQSYVDLVGNQASNFSFSGPGVVKIDNTTYHFVPGLVGVGSGYRITYIYTNPATGCSNSTYQDVNVIPPPAVDFTISKNEFCKNEAAVLLQGSALPGPSGPIFGVFQEPM